jgi:hypothetical protein
MKKSNKLDLTSYGMQVKLIKKDDPNKIPLTQDTKLVYKYVVESLHTITVGTAWLEHLKNLYIKKTDKTEEDEAHQIILTEGFLHCEKVVENLFMLFVVLCVTEKRYKEFVDSCLENGKINLKSFAKAIGNEEDVLTLANDDLPVNIVAVCFEIIRKMLYYKTSYKCQEWEEEFFVKLINIVKEYTSAQEANIIADYDRNKL